MNSRRLKLRALAVTAKKRSAALPDVPTLEDIGITGQEAETMTGVFVPAGTPKAIVDPTSDGELTHRVHCGYCVARGQPNELVASAQEKWIRADEDGIDPLLDEAREGSLDIAFTACIQDWQLKPKRDPRGLHVSGLDLGNGSRRVTQQAARCAARHQFAQQLQLLCRQCGDQKVNARHIAAGSVETGNEAKIDRVGASGEYDRNCGSCSFGCQRSRWGDRNDYGRWVSDQFGGQCRQSLKATIGRNIFDRNIAAFDIAGFLEPLAESAELVIIDEGAAQ